MQRLYRAVTIVATCGFLFLTAPAAATQDADPAHDEPPTQAASQDEQETPPAKPAHPVADQRVGRAPDDISSEISLMKGKIDGLFQATPLKHAWVDMNDKLDAAVGLRLGLAYTALYQKASSARGPDEAGSGIFEFSGNWHLVGSRETNPGRLAFRAEGKHAYTTLAPNQLGASIGSLWSTADSFGEDDFALTQLWWEQFLFHNHLAFRVGKIKQKDIVNTGRFRSAKFFFLNEAFSGNPTLPYPDEGLGVGIDLIPTDLFYVAGVISDANASSTSSGFGTLFQDADFFTSLEIGLTPHLPNLGGGHYRLTVWHQEGREDAGTSSGNGISLSFDQELGNGLVPFLRYGYDDSGLTPTRQYLAGGFGMPTPFGRKNDTFGVGVAWGEPEDSSFRDQYVAEVFYRIQVTPSLSLTPSVQVIFDPSIALNEDVVGVFSMRARVAF